MSSCRQNPTILPVAIEILILRHLDKRDVAVERIGTFVSARLSALARLQKNGQICWLLYLCICLQAPIRASAVSELFGVEDGAVALLVSDANRLGVINGSIDQSSWNCSLTADGLRSPMWLYAYESALKNLNGTGGVVHVTSDQYFGPLLALDVEFYRSGSFYMNRNKLLARLRLARLRHQIEQHAVEDDLAENYDDFDEMVDELY